MSHTELGKIRKVHFGLGGYQDAQIVFSFELGGDGWGTTYTYECGWGHVTEDELKKPGCSYKWTHENRIKQLGEKAWDVFKLMRDAKVSDINKLIGIPVRVNFESQFGRVVGFEILKEVL